MFLQKLAAYRAALAEHATTVDQPAPFPEHEILRQIGTQAFTIDEEQILSAVYNDAERSSIILTLQGLDGPMLVPADDPYFSDLIADWGGTVQDAPTPPPPDPRLVTDREELAAAKADANLMALIDMSPAQISNAIDAAFPDAQQRVILKRICRVLIPTARRVFRS